MDPEASTINPNMCNHIMRVSPDDQPHGNLYLGPMGALKSEILQTYGITAALSVMDAYMYQKRALKERVVTLKLNPYKWVDLQDSEDENISQHLEDCYNFIEQSLKSHNVLVHCQAGISRSATIVIYYVMRKLNLSLQLAIKLVTSKRYMVSPNEGFMVQLQKQEQKLATESKLNKWQEIKDPYSQFSTQKYPQKFANHIVSLNEGGQLHTGNLFLGQFSILKSHFIKSLLITSVVSVVDEPYYKRMKVKQILDHEGIANHLWINIRDEPQQNIANFFQQSFDFIDQHIQKGNVLVHCQAGVSRSASVVTAFLIKKFKVSFKVALKFVQSKRKVVNPNEGFQLGLVEYSEKILST